MFCEISRTMLGIRRPVDELAKPAFQHLPTPGDADSGDKTLGDDRKDLT